MTAPSNAAAPSQSVVTPGLTGSFDHIPVVDLARARGSTHQRDALIHELCRICHQVGFFVVINHGVAAQTVTDMFAMVDQLFALSDDDKRRIDKLNSPHFRGWEAVGSEYTNNLPDLREQVDLWTDHEPRLDGPNYNRLLGPNQYLPDSVLPGFRARADAWFECMGSLASELVQLLSASLGLEPTHLDEFFERDQPMSLIKLISYPPTPPGGAGVNPHHDAGFLTILAPGSTPGLQVQNQLGQWVDVPVIPNSFVINLGEMLQGMTGNYFVATPHRVITAQPRTSVGYFHGPSLDTSLDRLPLAPRFAEAVEASKHHRSAGFMARREETEQGVAEMSSTYKPAVYGEQLWNYFARSYPNNMARHHGDLPA